MKYRTLKPAAASLVAGAALALMLATPVESVAQKSTPPPSQDRAKTYDQSRELRGREENITLMEHGKNETLSREAILAQMNEDFARIQALNGDLATAYAASGSPDYKRISEGSIEMRKRASRLKNSLMLPPGAKDEKGEKSKEEKAQDPLASSLKSLDGLVKSFVANPIFRKDTGLDYQQVAKARRDLDGIIAVSDQVKKAADKMNQTSSHSN